MLTNNITSIGVGLQNEKYIGTINGGLLYFDSTTTLLANYTIENSGVPDNSALKVKIDSLGKPWYAGSAGGLFTDPGNQTWLSFNYNNSPMPTNSLTTFELDSENTFYMGTQQDGLVIRRYDQDWDFYTTNNSLLPENHILSLVKDMKGNLWIGTYSKGLVKLKEETLGASLNQNNPSMFVRPNPIQKSGEVYFSRPLKNPKITIISSDARVVYQELINQTTDRFKCPLIESGSYLLVLEHEDQTTIIRATIM